LVVLLSLLAIPNDPARGQTSLPFAIGFWYPTNGQTFTAPANVGVHAWVIDSNLVQTVQYFSGTNSLGTVTNTSGVTLTNTGTANPFFLLWSNVPAGSYTLTAVATDAAHLTATSSPVTITVVTPPPPPPVRPAVYIYSPTNGAMFLVPANLTLYARAVESTGVVQTVEFFAGSTSLGVVSNSSQGVFTNISKELLFPLGWSNVLAGSFALKAVATDAHGMTATSSVVSISVVTNFPPPPVVRPSVYIYSPTNYARFLAPTNLTLYARAVETTGVVQTVEFFAGHTSLGVAPNSSQVVVSNLSTAPLFPLVWSNVLAGSYALTAVATDARGITATSSVVNISVVTNLPPPPVVRPSVYIYSPTNYARFVAPTNLTLYARAVETTGVVQTVEFFAGSTSLGVVPNSSQGVFTNISTEPLFPLVWSNVLAGSYALTAVGTDARGITATSSVVNISVVTNLPPPPVVRPYVYIYSPTNNARFVAPANLTLYARAFEPTGVVQTVEFFAGHTSLGVVPNSSQVVVSNLSSVPLFPLGWSNVLAGSYELRAVATDAGGITATSSVVNITVVSNVPPPSLPFAIHFLYPTNDQAYTAPASVGLHAWVIDSNLVLTVQYFAGATSIGIVTNTAGVMLTNTSAANPFFLLWSNVPAGSYALTAVAADSGGLQATSAPVNIYVLSPPPHTNRPPEVRITSPPNAAVFRAPVNIPIYVYAHDANGYVTSVEFLAGTNSLGFGSPIARGTNTPPTSYYSNYFSLVWSNALSGSYALTAIVTDNSNAVAVSLPVNITVLPPLLPPSKLLPIVTISAIDPIAIEGTNCWVWSSTTNTVPTWTNWPGSTRILLTNCGPKNATFSIYRSGETNSALTVTYAISGTASNGVDYVALPGAVTIPAGQRVVMIPVVPIDDGPPDLNSTVILKLTPSTTRPLAYVVGSPGSAAALILDSPSPTQAPSTLSDRTFHLSAAGPNGAWFHVEYTTDMLNWTPICTNQVINGSIDFIDPSASTTHARFYRAVPETNPPQ
jgi:hypothetical protein